jgi:phosphate-selective porin OprO/OprP
MKLKITLLMLSFFAFSLVNAQENDTPTFGNGIFNLKGKDSTWSMKIGMQLQFQAYGQFEEQDGKYADSESNFFIRRARLKFDGFAYSPKLTYKIVLGLSNRDISGASVYTSNAPRYILDAVMKWNFYENFEFWFGQTKLPGSREQITSSGNLQFVGRSLLNSTYNIDRDLGIQLRHHFKLSERFLIREAFAISQGEGRNITTGNLGGFQYTSRLELLPFGAFIKDGDYLGGDLYREPSPKLALGFTYDYNENAVKTRSNQGSYMLNDRGLYETDISTVFIDAMFKYQGFSFMAEYADRTADKPLAKDSDGTLTGAAVQIGSGLNLQLGYLFQNNWELSGRYTNITSKSLITGNDDQKQYTLGVSKYIVGHKLKVQSDVSYLNRTASDYQLICRVQFAVHF